MQTTRERVRDVEIRPARPEDFAGATAVTVRAFRDNPMTAACWGSNPARRERGLRTLFGEFLPSLPIAPFVAIRDNIVVGVLGMAPPATCLKAPLGPTLRVLTSMLLRSPATANRFRQWMLEYERHDLKEVHWHLGPVAVDPDFQHAGIGSRMLDRFCALVDTEHGVAYLETDAVHNIRLYERFDFETIDQQSILGATNWFMRRGARG